MDGSDAVPVRDARWWQHADKRVAREVFTEWFDVVGDWVARREGDPDDLGCFTRHAGGGILAIGGDLCRWLAANGIGISPVFNLVDGIRQRAGQGWGTVPSWEELEGLLRRAEEIKISAKLDWLSLVDDEMDEKEASSSEPLSPGARRLMAEWADMLLVENDPEEEELDNLVFWYCCHKYCGEPWPRDDKGEYIIPDGAYAYHELSTPELVCLEFGISPNDFKALSIKAQLVRVKTAIAKATAAGEHLAPYRKAASEESAEVLASPATRSEAPLPLVELDGPAGVGKWRHEGVIHSGLNETPWVAAQFVWSAKDRSTTFSKLAAEVYGDPVAGDRDNLNAIGSWRREINIFLKGKDIPWIFRTKPSQKLAWFEEAIS
jgi:hypothetical protein